MAKEKRRESPSGFHYFNLYQNCPWKFYLRYLVGLASFYTEPPLSAGGAFHEGKATWYKTGDLKAAIKVSQRFLRDRKRDYQDENAYNRDYYRVPTMLTQWIYDWGETDLEVYNIKEVEVQHAVPLPNRFKLTIRPDFVGERKDNGLIFIHETKTTGYSALVTEQGVALGDQATSYLWALSVAHPSWKIEGVIPDISYWHKGSTDAGKIRNSRGAVVRRDEEQLNQFAVSTMNILSDISQRVKAVQSGMNPHAAFPRNTQWCTSYARPCEYAGICRTPIDPDRFPPGFVRDPWAERHQVLNFPKIKTGGTHGSDSKKKAATAFQAPLDPAAARVLIRHYLRARSLSFVPLRSRSRLHRMVDHDRNVRDGLALLLRSWDFRWLAPARRQRYLDHLSNGHSREASPGRRTRGGHQG